ncbi:DUF4065 domain-containing protein [Campylobacter coli]|uniref:DUF4065 domain-containing protein n=6 Tax=Campylobacteraceae TaxID=72294 RepID=A0A381CGQ3_CAMCO|nr:MULTISPECIES: type II toxin-antitoxin system antitoxin SocA domain-containing protein [Campylobacter]EAK3887911.1 DUF4065 domain-containing protein [Campylobacter hyointestinalis]EAL3816757.1 DUF4065 domain-containing protein [Campylobacter fetus]EIA78347.1 hypothetical protein cco6_09326 [Campylobacter coli 59-2]EIB05440.1 hypothetical protein cco88_09754 [Campylobacter coli LMG 9860]OEW16786.1 hypothetical protein AJ936_01920 [Campylobacter sp. BCW_6877]
MRKMDAASEKRLIEAVSYLKKISKDALMARLYQKILFLLELKYYQQHSRPFIGINFKSYKFGPFSLDVAKALDDPKPNSECSNEVKEKIDEILKEYNLNRFDQKTMGKSFKKMIDYIHSLVFYNLTPFDCDFNFDNYSFEDLFERINSKLDGKKLEDEKYKFALINQKAKEYECLFQI